MEVFLRSCNVVDNNSYNTNNEHKNLLSAEMKTKLLNEIGIKTIADIATKSELDTLCNVLQINKDHATTIILKAKETVYIYDTNKRIVQTTWKTLTEEQDNNNNDITKQFYINLFQTFPNLKPLFDKIDTNINVHAENLYKSITKAIQYLDDVDKLIPLLEEMGEKHAAEFECERRHYDKVGECLFWTLKTNLGDDQWTKEVSDAWIWVYNVFEKTMIESGEKYLYKRRKNAVLKTWHLVEESLEIKNHLATDATKLFYEHLFLKHPSIKTMFENTTDINIQAIKLFKTISLAIHFLDDDNDNDENNATTTTDELKLKLQEIGIKHYNEYNIEREHYDALGECLLWTLKKGLGDAWTDEVADAWAWVYRMMAKTMVDAVKTPNTTSSSSSPPSTTAAESSSSSSTQ